MIILDTNVLSALMQRRPDTTVIDWLDKQPAEAIWISSITLFESRYGLNLLAEGDRRSALIARFDEILQTDLANRILVFDVRAATKAAELAAVRKSLGRPIELRDTFIAGIAMAHGATLATRNTRHFGDLPSPVVNPWE
ncbi:MAG: type II toxin-antitoxin system VapC family toxin [Methylococcaceae bacterium]|nr:type II toxin-antitoxin system VapC family toxin [Methylococcaceae bacterium]